MSDNSAADKIRRIFDEVVENGFRREAVEGATDQEIDSMAAAQGIRQVPESIREVLRILGKKAPVWFSGTGFGVNSMDRATKIDAMDCLDEAATNTLQDPDNILVVAEGGSYSYVVIDGSDLTQPDPPLWLLSEGGRVEQRWDSVTTWFALRANGVADRQRRLAERRRKGRPDAARERYFRWETTSDETAE
ncbi:hypothetical protein ACWDYH_31980 [Nocardia goodfellowii]